MKTAVAEGRGPAVSAGRRAVPVVIGAALILFGLTEFLSIEPSVVADTLRNADVMSIGLGLQFFAGLMLMAYGLLIAGRRLGTR